MKLRVYSTTKNTTVQKALNKAKGYFSDVTFSDITMIDQRESDRSLYEVVMSWFLNVLTPSRSIKLSYLQSLDSTGYDGVVLFVDKAKAREDATLYGQHIASGGKSYIQIYDTDNYFKFGKDSQHFFETYVYDEVGSSDGATNHALIHEVFHALSSYYNVPDILHPFIEEGLFDEYKHYLDVNKKHMDTNAEKLYKTAHSCIGIDITPDDTTPDVVACAATVNALHKKTFGVEIGGGSSTYNLYAALLKHPDFTRVDTPLRGDVVISPTGYAGQGSTIPNGHTGIVGDSGIIMSNDSASGLLKENYTLDTWRTRYVIKGKYPMVYFRRK